MSFETDIQVGVAELLAAHNIALWSGGGAYPNNPTKPVIVIRAVPDKPDAIITIATYPVRGGSNPDDSILGVQIVTRCAGKDPRPCDDLDGAVYDCIHNLSNVTLGKHRVTRCEFQSGVSLGQDPNGRWSRTANYYLTLPR